MVYYLKTLRRGDKEPTWRVFSAKDEQHAKQQADLYGLQVLKVTTHLTEAKNDQQKSTRADKPVLESQSRLEQQ